MKNINIDEIVYRASNLNLNIKDIYYLLNGYNYDASTDVIGILQELGIPNIEIFLLIQNKPLKSLKNNTNTFDENDIPF